MPRLSVALDHTTKARLDWLKKTTEAPSLMSVIRRGAQLYEMLIAHNQARGLHHLARQARTRARRLDTDVNESAAEHVGWWALCIVWLSSWVALQGLLWWGLFWMLGIV